MNKLEVIIRHFRLEDVKSALTAIGVQGVTVTEVRGLGRQVGHHEEYRGAQYSVDFLPSVKIELTVADEMVEKATEAVCAAARTGQVGDGKIFVSYLEQVIRIRTGEAGKENDLKPRSPRVLANLPTFEGRETAVEEFQI